MRKKGGQRLMEMNRRKRVPRPATEEVAPVKRFTDSDRFDQPILHDVGPIVEELPPEPPPAPARQDFLVTMFPRLSAAVDLFGQIDLSKVRQARGEAGRKQVDKAAGEALMDSVLLKQLSDLENRLSVDVTPKNLPQIKRRLNERRIGGVLTPIDEEKASQAILKRLQANRTKSGDPEVRKAEKLAELEAKQEYIEKQAESYDELAQVEIPIMAFDDMELESLLPDFGLEKPTKNNLEALQLLVDGYEAETGEVRTVLQALVVLSHREMDEKFYEWMRN
jgi:hypothetical protein|tara:strand:- start:279 stop:1115 length:837 start_codon:yes stop_codon:yes gene_type:complete